MAKSQSLIRDIVQVLLFGLGIGVLLTVIGFVVSLAVGIPALKTAEGGNGGGNIAALIPTPVPPTATPTEIPCTAPEWWAANSVAMGEVFTQARATTVQTRVPDVQTAQAALKVWQTSFELTDQAPPCANGVKQAALNAAQQANDLYNYFVTTSTDADRAQQAIRLADALLGVYDGLEALDVNVTDQWLLDVRDYTRSDCPVARWYTEQFIGRGYKTYFDNPPRIDVQNLTSAQMNEMLVQMRTFRSSLNTDKANFPACVIAATDYLINYFDAGMNALNSALNGDMNSVQGSLVLLPTALNAFYAEIAKLDPNLVR